MHDEDLALHIENGLKDARTAIARLIDFLYEDKDVWKPYMDAEGKKDLEIALATLMLLEDNIPLLQALANFPKKENK